MSSKQQTIAMAALAAFQAGLKAPFHAVSAAIPDPEVYDVNGQRRNLAWLVGYGWPIEIKRADPHPSCANLVRIVRIDVRQGPATQMVRCIDSAGRGLNKVAIARWWRDAPGLNPYPSDCYATKWHTNAAIGWTNENGDVGFGVGPGDTPGSSGIWVLHCAAPGDWVGGLGMHNERGHEMLALIFQVQPKDQEPEPEPGPTGDVAKEIAALNATFREAFRLQ